MSSGKQLEPPPPYSDSTPESSLLQGPTAESKTTVLSWEDSPSSDNASATYTIGLHIYVRPLVSISHLKSHLRLMRAFRDLRDRAESSAVGREVGDARIVFVGNDAAQTQAAVEKMSGSTRWEWIVALAVERCVAYMLLV